MKNTSQPPPSVSSLTINITAFFISLFALIACIQFKTSISTNTALAIIALSAIVPILAFELATQRISWKYQQPFNLKRILIKLLAFYCCIALIAFIYWLFPEYHHTEYEHYFQLITLCLPYILFLAIPYFAITDRLMTNSCDGYWHLGCWLLRRPNLSKPAYTSIKTLLLGWIIKLFFLPLMWKFITDDINTLKHFNLTLFNHDTVYQLKYCLNFIYYIDLLYAFIGYAGTFCLFNTQIQSVEPTFFGWFIALACYGPFSHVILGSYLDYHLSRVMNSWIIQHFYTVEILSIFAIIFTFIYALSTVTFGIRFSNLTHRGILTNGPYRHTKHPAYIYKNLSWWSLTIPIIASSSWQLSIRSALLLLLVNLIYFLRAKTEERHLSWDPTYIAYAKYIEQYGTFSFMGRWFPVLKFKAGHLLNLRDKTPCTPTAKSLD